MQIRSLLLQNFRSYRKAAFNFSPEVTLLIGPNAIGKTNIMEALYVLATGKSFRAEKDSDIVAWGEEVARVRVTLNQTNLTNPTNKLQNTKNDEMSLEMVITSGVVNGEKVPVKKYLVNGVTRRQIDFMGNLHVVLFSPQDLEIVTNSPSLRRQYLNSVLVQTDREYRRNLYSYERGLRQRNRLLDFIKEGKASRSQLLFWNQLLIRTGSYLTSVRQSYIDSINTYELDDFHYRLVYDKSVMSQSRLDQYKEEEVAAGSTLVGPQRDDFIVTKSQITNHNDQQGMYRDVSRFGSRGEQRLAVLWVKLAELEYSKSVTGERPVLMLDDIFSELDSESRKIVLSIISQQQTIITSAEEGVIQLFNKTKNVKIIRLPIL
jgi:DNA replication and repair protein RecF